MPINLEVLGSAFVMIFLAELGDKTQIATFAFASEFNSPLSVFLGASVALVLTSVLGVAAGAALGRFVPARIMKVLSACVFLAFGVWTLVEAFRRQG